jgi:putative aldouronate transport system permease protein
MDGVTGSKWVGLEHFSTFIQSFYFWELIRNTLFYSFGKLLVSVPAAILLAVMLFECTRPKLAKVVQTLAYLPHFLSWVIMFGILRGLLSPSIGIVNDVIKFFGGEAVDFLANTHTFPWIVIISDAWKEMGWSAIIFIAALIGIDPTLFEAAMVEGVSAPQRVWYITLPSIKPVIVMVVLLRLGTILDAGFNQMFMLYSLPVYSVADIIDTWVYRQGLLNFQFGLATAVGIFKGVIGLLLLYISNLMVRKVSDSTLF